MTGPVLGRYRLEEQVGQGGMAVVWRGLDTQLGRIVAIKVLHPHLHARAEIRRRFDREAHAVARLHHPHILEVYDFSGPDAEPSYLVTEFIAGQTLRAFADAHPFDPPELAAACLLPIAEALEHAHGLGVVHRDLKPENVMVRDDGVVKLTDFGIAAVLDPDEKLTATGSILGSPAHLAPETIEGKPADPRSDLFSFGTILYWLSCGELPFRAPSPAALLRQILEGTAKDPRLVRRSVGDALAKVIARCLERDPDKRYQSARELKVDLLALLAAAGIDDAGAEVAAFVQGHPPEAHAEILRERLVSRALAAGEAAVAQKRTAAALAEFGHALALSPGNARAQAQLERIRRRARLRAFALRSAATALVALLVGFGGVGATRGVQGWLAHRDPGASNDAGLAAATGDAGSALAFAAPDAGVAVPEPEPARTSGSGSRPAHRPRNDAIAAAPRPVLLASGKIPVTLKVAYFWADVELDGVKLGSKTSFELQLAPGPHTAIVRHPCCEDASQPFTVVPGVDHYMLKLGAVRDAYLSVKNAEPDLRVLLNGGFLGTVGTLAAQPIKMGDKPDRDATVEIGDRKGQVRLQGGKRVEIDYSALAAEDGAR